MQCHLYGVHPTSIVLCLNTSWIDYIYRLLMQDCVFSVLLCIIPQTKDTCTPNLMHSNILKLKVWHWNEFVYNFWRVVFEFLARTSTVLVIKVCFCLSPPSLSKNPLELDTSIQNAKVVRQAIRRMLLLLRRMKKELIIHLLFHTILILCLHTDVIVRMLGTLCIAVAGRTSALPPICVSDTRNKVLWHGICTYQALSVAPW